MMSLGNDACSAKTLRLPAMGRALAHRNFRLFTIGQGISEGFEYVAGSMPIRTLLVLLGIVSMMSAPLTVLMPPLATETLHGGPHTLGLLTAALGVGALVASLFLAARRSVIGLKSVIAVATGVFGLGMAGLSLSHTRWTSLVLLVVTGFAMVAQMAASNAVLQTVVEENKRGRVMSFHGMAFCGMGPLGSLLAGCLASTLGTAVTFLIFGMVCVTGSLVFAARPPGRALSHVAATAIHRFANPTLFHFLRRLLRALGYLACRLFRLRLQEQVQIDATRGQAMDAAAACLADRKAAVHQRGGGNVLRLDRDVHLFPVRPARIAAELVKPDSLRPVKGEPQLDRRVTVAEVRAVVPPFQLSRDEEHRPAAALFRPRAARWSSP